MVETFGVGDIVGCHLDRIKNLAFFTVNGKVIGEQLSRSPFCRMNQVLNPLQENRLPRSRASSYL